MTTVNACSVITGNRLASARVLATSFRRHHPDGTLIVLVLDDLTRSIVGEDFEAIGPDDLAIEPSEFFRMATSYGPLQLACAMKPWVLEHVLATTGDTAIYLDSDIEVFGSLGGIPELARRHSVVLSPHLTEPPPRPPGWDEEAGKLLGGTYNAGFIAVGTGAAPFLRWWRDRLSRECVYEPARGLYDDQRWLDLVPSYFDHVVLRDPGYNVAFWNLLSRDVQGTGNGYEVNGEPLRFFHFGGFEPEHPHVVSKWQRPKPIVLLSERPAVAEICRNYATRISEAGFEQSIRLPYGLAELSNGLRFDPIMRELYRTALVAFERENGPEPPNPFVDGSAAFVSWLTELPERSDTPQRVPRYLLGLWRDDPELQRTFPDLLGEDAARYVAWAAGEGVDTGRVPRLLASAPKAREARAIARPERLEPGVNLVHPLESDSTLSEVAGMIAGWLERSDIRHVLIPWDSSAQDGNEPFPALRPETAPFATTLVCLNPLDLGAFAFDVDADFFQRRHSTGVWLEEDIPTPALEHALAFLDEVWVGSDFAAHALTTRTQTEVRVFPVPVVPPEPGTPNRRRATNDDVRFLSIAEFGGMFAPGKLPCANPLGVVEAFRHATAQDGRGRLLIRCVNGERQLVDLEEVRLAAAGAGANVEVVDGPLSAQERRELIDDCDCFVSLHRSTEFGVALADAMVRAKPVIATAYSGNLQFANGANSLLVAAEREPMPPEYASYWCGRDWAVPDLYDAATLIRRVAEQPDDAMAIAERGREVVLRNHGVESLAAFLTARLGEIMTMAPKQPCVVPPVEPAPAPLPSPVDHAAAYLAAGPQNRWDTPSRFGAIGRASRRMVLRLLRPYTIRHAELDTAVVDALRDLAREQAETQAKLAEVLGDRRDGR